MRRRTQYREFRIDYTRNYEFSKVRNDVSPDGTAEVAKKTRKRSIRIRLTAFYKYQRGG